MSELKPCEHLNVTVTTTRGPYCVDCGALLVSVFSGVERAQPAQAGHVPEASCGECGKKASDGWALYCVACMEKAGLPAQAGQVPPDVVRDAERWRMLRAYFHEYRIDAMKLYRDIDAAIAQQKGHNVNS